ncbi:MAG: aldo/keto reductase [Clostridia bacterium]|jgi:predicted aldo/keto reductase-like oxidoreductase|nr:aldo/keto reductase [Clostridia bacterium]MCI1999252.1 aldo/keto reductase [Clostridia bacterium]MCI2014795.1 aldo/keto reductase [Clostridia bacterium]
MQYRKFKDINLSAIGLGMMRLPVAESGGFGKSGTDIEKTTEMVRYAVENGVNYIDTAFNYMSAESEKVTGIALDGIRDKVYIATKAPTWLFKESSDFDTILAKQLNRLKTDHIDFYLLHSMNKKTWKKTVVDLGIIEKLFQAKKDGKIKYAGFSFHDDYDTFKEIIDTCDWDFCQIQLNYLDTKNQAGIKGLEYAFSKNIPVNIMEPLRGGYLADIPESVKKVFDTSEHKKSPVEWGLDYLWNRKEVCVVLSGMSNIEQVKENIEYASRASIGMIDEKGAVLYDKACNEFGKLHTIPCTGCSYCMPCPKNVAIPYNFNAYNQYKTSHDYAANKRLYDNWVPMFGEKSSACVGCKKCEEICPQHIKISEWMPKITELFK